MPKTKAKYPTAQQEVDLFPDEPMTGMQTAHFDSKDNWITFSHNGEYISMHEYNFLRLVELVNSVRNPDAPKT